MKLSAAVAFASLRTANTSKQANGFRIIIEHPKGSIRELEDDKGKVIYRKRMFYDYGYFPGTKGRDGDGVDVFVGPMGNASEVFIVHMKDLGPVKDAREDEDKVMLGFPSADAAKQAFLLHYPKNFYESLTALPLADFKKKMKTASLPYYNKKIHAAASCPKCGSKNYSLMPTDFETAKCKDCGKVWDTAVRAGGPGSGCHGDSCGRPAGEGSKEAPLPEKRLASLRWQSPTIAEAIDKGLKTMTEIMDYARAAAARNAEQSRKNMGMR